jgi:H+-translocating NAD(P) transhydrogenase subunit alpha
MRVAIARERAPGERRVALTPEVAARLIDAGHSVAIETDAGASAHFDDMTYRALGVEVTTDPDALVARADVLCAVQAPHERALADLRPGAAIVGSFQPAEHDELVNVALERRLTSFSLDLLPRISRAQPMDALSSQSTVAGYCSALLAATYLPRFFPGLITAAGTVTPAHVLVLGTGVAGLHAIATARRLGADVYAHDVRPSSPEEVQSLGATFVELGIVAEIGSGGYAREQSSVFLARQRDRLADPVADADAVITTAAVPGRRAPTLISAAMVERMRSGSVIVDLGAESGGNCELSVAGEVVDHGGVTIVGPRNLVSTLATDASALYARNVAGFIGLLTTSELSAPNFEDEILSATCVTFAGRIRHAPTAEHFSTRDE